MRVKMNNMEKAHKESMEQQQVTYTVHSSSHIIIFHNFKWKQEQPNNMFITLILWKMCFYFLAFTVSVSVFIGTLRSYYS